MEVPIKYACCLVEVMHEILKFKKATIEVLCEHIEQTAHLINHLRPSFVTKSFLAR